ncbi:MAG: DUF6498-containing protein [Pseudomonadota bacterium]
MATQHSPPEHRSHVAFFLLLALNAVPLIGVFAWNWQSFDLILLYWMENVIIGVFTLARMIVRPYEHPIDFLFPGFLVPFFGLHYGMFCFGHGTFILAMFGTAQGAGADEGLLALALNVLGSLPMLLAIAALTLLQLFDWLQDVRERGFGADGIKELMVKPYRRIIVLHLTIIAGGFALTALDEPTVGLVILVLVKTGSDVWHWRKEHGAAAAFEEKVPTLTAERLAAVAAEYPEPVLTVNGKEKRFASFQEMKASREFHMAQAVMRFAGASAELKLLTAYLDQRIADELLKRKPEAGDVVRPGS